MSAPPGSADPERWARLLAAAEVALRGGTAREVRRGGRIHLAVAEPGEGERVMRVVVEAAGAEPVVRLVPADGGG
jgi:hypothetical protein